MKIQHCILTDEALMNVVGGAECTSDSDCPAAYPHCNSLGDCAAWVDQQVG